MRQLVLLGDNATEEEFEAWVADVLELATPDEDRHLAGKHDQKTHGKKTISEIENPNKVSKKFGSLTDDPTRMENLPPDYRAAMEADLAKTFPGMTPAQLEANLDAQLKEALADPELAVQKDWYLKAHQEAARLAADNPPLTPEQSAAAIAALSPQQEWANNVGSAKYTMEALRKNPEIKLSEEEMDIARNGLAGHKVAMPDPLPARLNDITGPDAPMIKAALIKGMAKDAGVQVARDSDGQLVGMAWSSGLIHQARAVQLIEGGDPDQILSGHKVRSFHNDIVAPRGLHGSVTIDTHALSAAVRTKVTANDDRQDILRRPKNNLYGSAGSYALFATAYRNVAAANNLLPHEAQALIWLKWRRDNT